jgi:xanthine dehydrogenase YagS FAD-binding subunit
MHPFAFITAADEVEALRAGRGPSAQYIAGGTTLIDLMRLGVAAPLTLVDVTALPLGRVEPTEHGVRIGAMVRNSDLARHPLIRQGFPVLAEALLSGASPQLRNMATVGGNLMQRTRCSYFRDIASACNKRAPGAGCSAINGYSRLHAVLGTSDHCIATHPSDMCVALVALDAVVRTRAADGSTRTIPIVDFHTVPGDHPNVECALAPDELITHVDLPASPYAARSHYLKVRDRASYAFALASAAVALDLRAGIVRDARIALGGVGTKPWRCHEAEQELSAMPATRETFERAAAAAVRGARATKDNAFKIGLAQRTLVRALLEAS